MIICVANTSPEKVRLQLASIDFTNFSMWKEGETCKPNRLYGFFNFEDLKKSKVRTIPFFFNIVSAFNHIAINHKIFKYDFYDRPTGLIFFQKPNLKALKKVLEKKFSCSSLESVAFHPAKMSSGKPTNLSTSWNNFILTLPFQVAETLMICFLTCVKKNDVKTFHKFITDNRLIGTGNKKAYEELDSVLHIMWPVLYAISSRKKDAENIKKSFLKERPDLESSISRFLFWKKSYKGKILENFLDNENNVSYGID